MFSHVPLSHWPSQQNTQRTRQMGSNQTFGRRPIVPNGVNRLKLPEINWFVLLINLLSGIVWHACCVTSCRRESVWNWYFSKNAFGAHSSDPSVSGIQGSGMCHILNGSYVLSFFGIILSPSCDIRDRGTRITPNFVLRWLWALSLGLWVTPNTGIPLSWIYPLSTLLRCDTTDCALIFIFWTRCLLWAKTTLTLSPTGETIPGTSVWNDVMPTAKKNIKWIFPQLTAFPDSWMNAPNGCKRSKLYTHWV